MTDLRELLQQAAGQPPATVPMDGIRRRGIVLARRRRTVAGVLIAVLAMIIGVTATRVHSATNAPLTPAPQPSPVVTPGILPPGTYFARTLSPKVTLTVPEGSEWRVSLVTGNSLVLNSDPLGMVMSLQRWTAVYPPAVAGATAPPPLPRPSDVIAWLAGHPALKITGSPAATSLGGRPAHRITFTLDPRRRGSSGPAVGCTDEADCVVLADTPDNAVLAYSSFTTTVIADDDPNGFVLTTRVRTGILTNTTPLVQIRTVG